MHESQNGIVEGILYAYQIDKEAALVVVGVLPCAEHAVFESNPADQYSVIMLFVGVEPVFVGKPGEKSRFESVKIAAEYVNIHVIVPRNEPSVANRSQCAAAGKMIGDMFILTNRDNVLCYL